MPAAAVGWAGSVPSGSLVGWVCVCDRIHGMSGRKGWRSSEFTLSLLQICFKGAAWSPCSWLRLCFSSQGKPSRGHLWLMGNTKTLCSLIWSSQSPAGDRVVSLSLSFGNTSFTNMKYMSIHMCMCHARFLPSECICIHLYFQISTVLPCHQVY